MLLNGAEALMNSVSSNSLETVGLLHSSKYDSVRSENYNSNLIENGMEGVPNDIRMSISSKFIDFDPIIEDDEGAASKR